MAAAGKAGAAGATAGYAHRGSIEEILKDMDLGTPPTSEANIPTLPRPRANPTARTGRIVVTPGGRSAEVALSRNFHALRTSSTTRSRRRARPLLTHPALCLSMCGGFAEQLWKQRDQIAQDERLALRIANEELRTCRSQRLTLYQSVPCR